MLISLYHVLRLFYSLLFFLLSLNFFFFMHFIEVWLTYNVSGTQQGDTDIHILFFRLFSSLGYNKILTIVPCAIQ